MYIHAQPEDFMSVHRSQQRPSAVHSPQLHPRLMSGRAKLHSADGTCITSLGRASLGLTANARAHPLKRTIEEWSSADLHLVSVQLVRDVI